jgi:hypothetical protein
MWQVKCHPSGFVAPSSHFAMSDVSMGKMPHPRQPRISLYAQHVLAINEQFTLQIGELSACLCGGAVYDFLNRSWKNRWSRICGKQPATLLALKRPRCFNLFAE